MLTWHSGYAQGVTFPLQLNGVKGICRHQKQQKAKAEVIRFNYAVVTGGERKVAGWYGCVFYMLDFHIIPGNKLWTDLA